MNEVDQIKQIKDLFYSSQFQECIQQCNDYSKEYQDFLNYQTAMLYKCLSYFYIDQYDEVQINIKNLIEISEKYKEGNVEQIDLIIRIFHLQQVFDENFYIAEQLIQTYGECFQKYKQKYNSYQLSYDPIYLFAQAMFSFIENWRDEQDLQCIILLKKSITLDQQYQRDIQFMIGWMYAQKDQYSEALQYFLTLEEENPNYPGILNSIGVTYSRLKNKLKAEEYYLKSYNKYPYNTLYINNLAQFYNQCQEVEKSRHYFQVSLKTNPKKVLTLYFYGYFLCKHKEFDEGLTYLNRGLEINPNSSDIWNALAVISKDFQQSQEKYEEYTRKCIELEPNNGQFYEALGIYFIDEGSYDKAAEELQRALSHKLFRLNYHSTCSNLAYCYFELERWEESLTYYIKSLNYPVVFETSQDIESICNILDEKNHIPFNKKIEILNSQQGPFLSRLDLIISSLQNTKIKNILTLKLSQFRQFLTLVAYQIYIQPNLTYMSEISHWDLFID